MKRIKNDKIIADSVAPYGGATLFYRSTTTQGGKWSFPDIISSSYVTYGSCIIDKNKIYCNCDCNYARISASVKFMEDSYNFKNEVRIMVKPPEGETRYYQWFSSVIRQHIIPSIIIPVSRGYAISFGYYTNDVTDRIYTTDEDNFLCVEIIA